MRKMKALVALAFAVLVMPMLMGATVGLTVTPNPGGKASTLQGAGPWAVAVGETFGSISFQTTLLNTQQTTFNSGTTAGANWSSSMSVTPNTYNPSKVTLYYTIGAMPAMTSASNAMNQVVK